MKVTLPPRPPSGPAPGFRSVSFGRWLSLLQFPVVASFKKNISNNESNSGFTLQQVSFSNADLRFSTADLCGELLGFPCWCKAFNKVEKSTLNPRNTSSTCVQCILWSGFFADVWCRLKPAGFYRRSWDRQEIKLANFLKNIGALLHVTGRGDYSESEWGNTARLLHLGVFKGTLEFAVR